MLRITQNFSLKLTFFVEDHFYLSHCKAGLENVNLVICSNVSQSTFDHAKNMIEWMSDRVIQKFTQKREQPYEFKNAKAGYILPLSFSRSAKIFEKSAL